MRNVSPPEASESEGGAKGKPGGLPCRILVEVKGVEWFIYNRSPQYDWLMDEMATAVREDEDPQVMARHPHDIGNYMDGIDGDEKQDDPKTSSSTTGPQQPSATPAVESFEDMAAKSPYLRMLPIRVDCHRGAVVMGNNNTPGILVAHFEKAQGFVNARKVETLDELRQEIRHTMHTLLSPIFNIYLPSFRASRVGAGLTRMRNPVLFYRPIQTSLRSQIHASYCAVKTKCQLQRTALVSSSPGADHSTSTSTHPAHPLSPPETLGFASFLDSVH